MASSRTKEKGLASPSPSSPRPADSTPTSHEAPSPAALQRAITSPHQASPASILALQRTHGNQFVQRLLSPPGQQASSAPVIQRKGNQARLNQALDHLKVKDPERYARYKAILDTLSIADKKRIGALIAHDPDECDEDEQLSESEEMESRVGKLGGAVSREALRLAAEIMATLPGFEESHVSSFKNGAHGLLWAAKQDLPNLDKGEKWIIRPPQGTLNCLGHAVGAGKDIWIDSVKEGVGKGQFDYSYEVFDSILADYGFTETQGIPSEQTEIPIGAVVAYGKGDGQLYHFAKRVPGGFESKLGDGLGIFHAQLSQVTSEVYGAPDRLYLKKGMKVGPQEYD